MSFFDKGHHQGYVTRYELNEALRHVEEKMLEMAQAIEERMDTLEGSQQENQASIDAQAAALDQVATDLAASVAEIQTEVNNLAAAANAGQTLDFSALQSKVSALDTAAQAVGQIAPSTPTPPAPSPTPAPTPEPTPPAPEPTPSPATNTPAQTVYQFSGDPSTVDTSVWPRAPFNAADGTALFYYSGDTPGTSSQNGFGQAGWSIYTGAVVPNA